MHDGLSSWAQGFVQTCFIIVALEGDRVRVIMAKIAEMGRREIVVYIAHTCRHSVGLFAVNQVLPRCLQLLHCYLSLVALLQLQIYGQHTIRAPPTT